MRSSPLLFIAFSLLLGGVHGCGTENSPPPESVDPAVARIDAIPIVPLGVPLTPALGLPEESDMFLSTEVVGADDHLIPVEGGRIVVTVWNGAIQRVIYQTPIRNDDTLQQYKNDRILSAYTEDGSWDQGTEEESGTLYQRSDGGAFAFWTREMDYLIVETAEFRNALG